MVHNHLFAVVAQVWIVGLIVLAIVAEFVPSESVKPLNRFVALPLALAGGILYGLVHNTTMLQLISVKASNMGIIAGFTFIEFLVFYLGVRGVIHLLLSGKRLNLTLFGYSVLTAEPESNQTSAFIRQVLRLWVLTNGTVDKSIRQFKKTNPTMPFKQFTKKSLGIVESWVLDELVKTVRDTVKVEKNTTLEFFLFDVNKIHSKDEYDGLDNACQGVVKKAALQGTQNASACVIDMRRSVSLKDRFVARRIGDYVVLLVGNKKFDVKLAEDLLDAVANIVESQR